MSEDGWTVGTLATENFGTVETILTEKGIHAPILTPDLVELPHRTFVKSFDTGAAECLRAVKAQYGITADISYCFVKTATTNAFAARSPHAPGKYFIAFLSGVMFARTLVFEKLINDEGVRQTLEMEALGAGESEPVDSPDLRAILSLAFQWLVMHELGHIMNGHLHLDAATAFGAIASEAKEMSSTEERNVSLHTLEMDADSFASGMTVRAVLSAPGDQLAGINLFRTDALKIKTFGLCLYAMLRRFDFEQWSTGAIFSYSHPPALVRFAQIGAWGYGS